MGSSWSNDDMITCHIEDMNKLQYKIKFLRTTATGADVRCAVALQMDIPPENIAIIVGGKELNYDMLLHPQKLHDDAMHVITKK